MKVRRKRKRIGEEASSRPRSRGSHCPVCAGLLAGARWSCDRCHAGHHEDCARYSGGCALFGCAGGEARAGKRIHGRGARPSLAAEERGPVLRLLGAYLSACRMQALLGAFFVSAAVLTLLLAGSAGGVEDLPSRVAAIAGMVSGVLYLVLELVARGAIGRLRQRLGPDAARDLAPRPARFGHPLPLSRRSQNPERLEHGACPVAALGVIGLFVPALFATGALLLAGAALAYGAAGQLKGRWQELACFENRFRASFLPRAGRAEAARVA